MNNIFFFMQANDIEELNTPFIVLDLVSYFGPRSQKVNASKVFQEKINYS